MHQGDAIIKNVGRSETAFSLDGNFFAVLVKRHFREEPDLEKAGTINLFTDSEESDAFGDCRRHAKSDPRNSKRALKDDIREQQLLVFHADGS